MPISLFLATEGLSELLEVHFKFSFMLIGKLTMAFLTGQSWRVLKSWYIGGGPEQGFWRCFRRRTYTEFRFVCGADYISHHNQGLSWQK